MATGTELRKRAIKLLSDLQFTAPELRQWCVIKALDAAWEEGYARGRDDGYTEGRGGALDAAERDAERSAFLGDIGGE